MGEGIKTRRLILEDFECFASIYVTYDAGSVLTCTDGNKTFQANSTGGTWTFIIPYAGTWTVSMTDGTNSKSVEVSITTQGQSESVELYFRKMLYSPGDQEVFSTKSWKPTSNAAGSKAPTVTYNTSSVAISVSTSGGHGGIAYFTEKINLTGYSTLTAPGVVLSGSINKWQLVEGLRIWKELSGTDFTSASTASSCFGEGETTKDLTIDVSDLTGEYYIGFGLRYESSTKTLTVKEVYLE